MGRSAQYVLVLSGEYFDCVISLIEEDEGVVCVLDGVRGLRGSHAAYQE